MHIKVVNAICLLVVAASSTELKPPAFKTCELAAFCKRYRAWKDLKQRPILDAVEVKPIRIKPGSPESGLSLKIKSSAESMGNYGMRLEFASEDEVVRIQIDDISHNFERKRYRIPEGDIVMPRSFPSESSKSSERVSFSQSDRTSVLEHPNGSRVEVNHSPLMIALYNARGRLVQIINSKNFFAFEKYRERESNQVCPKGTNFDMSCHDGVDVSGLWEEWFGEWLDEKPYGPSAVGIDVELVNARSVFGLSQHTTSFNLPVFQETSSDMPEEEPYEEFRFFNGDVFEYPIGAKTALYGSIPFLTAVHDDGDVSGFLWLNPSETYVALTRRLGADHNIESTWVSETGVMDMFVFLGSTPQDVMKQYYSVTGYPALPPSFGLGHHQSKWGYKSQEEIIQVNKGFDTYEIPMDVLWLDIQHTDGNRYMTWGEKYSDPEKLTEAVVLSGRKLVTIVDPHIKVDEDYPVYARAKVEGLLVKTSHEKEVFVGKCWPGESVYLDVSTAKFRDFWKRTLSFPVYKGSSPNLWIWNDMNEPSVFNGPEMSLPRTVRFGDSGEIEHRDLHNLYGQYYHRATYEALLARETPAKRPFVLSRSFFAGSQRFGPIWTGDNKSEWSHLKASVSMLLSLAVCGISFVGADVGGFFGHPEKELFIRWHQLGALAYPFYRSHAHIDSPRREPWLYDQETLDIVRSVIDLRYLLLPYWYTAAALNTLEGVPIIKPLWFDHIADFQTVSNPLATEEEIMVGDSILVRGIFEPRITQAPVYLPGAGSRWYNLFDVHSPPVEGGRTISVGLTLSSIPAFVKAGSIIPLKITKRTSTLHMRDDPISFAVWPCTEGKATGFLYLDDEESMAFHESQNFALLRADFANRELTLTRIKGTRSLLHTFLAQIIVAGQDGTDNAKVKNVEELSTSVSLAKILGEHTIADVRMHLA